MIDIDASKVYSQLGLNHQKETSTKANDELGQTEFLELMTSQLKFQDPLKPMENGDFLAQMAQFGTVSGINELNTTFSSMNSSFQSNQALQASTLVGRKVLVPSDTAYLNTDNRLQASVEIEQAASRVVITIKDSSGQIVHRNNLGVQQSGMVDFEWNGQDESGQSLAPGAYQIEAEIHRGTSASAGSMLAVVDVESVTLGVGGQDLTLSVSGQKEIDMSQVRKIL
jgi:flagellar basal-body rod modification protein FlgD